MMIGLNWKAPTTSLVVSLLALFTICISSDQRFVGAITPLKSSVTAGVGLTVEDVARGGSSEVAEELALFRAMHSSILNRKDSGAFLAALDQSGGSTPKALKAYGMGPEEGNYEIGTER